MKKFLFSFLFVTIIISLASCNVLGEKTIVYDDHIMCDEMMKELTFSLQQKDVEKTKILFAPRLYLDSMFDINLENLINYYSGETKTINGLVDTGEYSNFDYEERHHGMEYDVETSDDIFRFNIIYIEKDTRSKNNVGIISLYVLKLSEDEYPYRNYCGAIQSTDGIHVAYPNVMPIEECE